MAKKGKVNCFGIPATKMDRALKSYAAGLGRSISPVPGMECPLLGASETDKNGVSKEVGAISGGVGKRGGRPRHTVIHIQVDDIDKAPEKIEDLGGMCCRRRRRWARECFAPTLRTPRATCSGCGVPRSRYNIGEGGICVRPHAQRCANCRSPTTTV